MAFRIGQKVVCVNNDMPPGIPRWKDQTYPQVGPAYTIRKILPHREVGTVLLLEEIVNQIPPGYLAEVGFDARRFRPMIERKTDISIFTAMLDKTPEHVG